MDDQENNDYTDPALAIVENNPKWAPLLWPLAPIAIGVALSIDLFKESSKSIAYRVREIAKAPGEASSWVNYSYDNVYGHPSGWAILAGIGAFFGGGYGVLLASMAVAGSGTLAQIAIGALTLLPSAAVGATAAVIAAPLAGAIAAPILGVLASIASATVTLPLGIRKAVTHSRKQKALKAVEQKELQDLTTAPADATVTVGNHRICGAREAIYGIETALEAFKQASTSYRTTPDNAKQLDALTKLQQAFGRASYAYDVNDKTIPIKDVPLVRALNDKAEEMQNMADRNTAHIAGML